MQYRSLIKAFSITQPRLVMKACSVIQSRSLIKAFSIPLIILTIQALSVFLIISDGFARPLSSDHSMEGEAVSMTQSMHDEAREMSASSYQGLTHSKGLAYGQGLGYSQGLAYNQGLGYSQGLGYNQGLTHSKGLAYGQGLGYSQGLAYSQGLEHSYELSQHQSNKHTLSVTDLLSWNKWGNGYFGNFRNRAVQMTEDPHSEGIMLVSPDSYGRDVVVTFDVMTLRPATVLVFMHSISDGDGSGTLAIPPGFDGAMSGWPQKATSYFFAFHNAPHFRHPFVNRWGADGVQLLQEADQSYMVPGKWHSVEVGRSGGRLWLQIDGQRILDVTDPEPFGAGHLAFRIRGSGTEIASCFIKDVVIHSTGH